MKKSQRMHIVIYVNVGNLNTEDVHSYMRDFREHVIKDFDADAENILFYFMPVRDQDTKIECINPVQVSKDEYSKIEDKMSVLGKKIDEVFEKLNLKTNN